MKISELIHSSIVEQLETLYKSERLAHAYLFIGPSLIGKSETALGTALVINEALKLKDIETVIDAADRQALCAKYPDLHFIASQFGETIKIEDIRYLLERIQFRPFQFEKKVFIIQNVENLTLEAANILLKTLEEPTEHNLFILTTSTPEKILSTVRSRCQPIYFRALAVDTLREKLREKLHCSREDAQFYARYSEGAWGQALDYHAQELAKLKNDWINQFISSRDFNAFLKSMNDKTTLKEFLKVLLCFVRDLILYKAQISEDYFIHVDRKKDFDRLSQHLTLEELMGIYQEVVQAQKLLSENLNIKISLQIIKERFYGKNG